jgi:hypothetical protein
MVLEHQAGTDQPGYARRLGCAPCRDAEHPLSDTATQRVDYLRFVDKALMPGPVEGPTSFAKNFSTRGPHDKKGRSFY